MPATWDDVSATARDLPETESGVRFGDDTWKVGKNVFVWKRDLRERDRAELGDAAPAGAVIGASVVDEGDKQALIASDPSAFFTTSHFDGYAAILIALDHVDPAQLREVVIEAWLARAPKRLVVAYLDGTAPNSR